MDGSHDARTDVLRIVGPVRLAGEVAVGGAKNAALPIMAASILADGPVHLDRVPNVTDVATLAQVLGHLGMQVDQAADHTLRIEPVDLSRCHAPVDLVRRMRASFCVLGPLLARRRRAVVPLPGGCNLGTRPVDLHLKGLAKLGADIRVTDGHIVARTRRLRGANIDLCGPRGPTVTGTVNVLCAATLADGTTTITHAATEPEIADLGRFLTSLGAQIEGLGTDTLVIRGVDQLGTANHRVIADRIEAATLLIAAAATGGQITVRDTESKNMRALLETLSATGCQLDVHRPTAPDEHESIVIRCAGPLRALRVVAQPYPGIPSDVQPQLVAMLALAEGTSQLHDEVFPARFDYTSELMRLGAKVQRKDGGVIVKGPSQLHAARVSARDLRGGAALFIAALASHGQTHLTGAHHIDRGYEQLDLKLMGLGAQIARRPLAPDQPLSVTAGHKPRLIATRA